MAPMKSPLEIALDTIDYGIWYSGEDCHDACCPAVNCRFERAARAAARKEARP